MVQPPLPADLTQICFWSLWYYGTTTTTTHSHQDRTYICFWRLCHSGTNQHHHPQSLVDCDLCLCCVLILSHEAAEEWGVVQSLMTGGADPFSLSLFFSPFFFFSFLSPFRFSFFFFSRGRGRGVEGKGLGGAVGGDGGGGGGQEGYRSKGVPWGPFCVRLLRKSASVQLVSWGRPTQVGWRKWWRQH